MEGEPMKTRRGWWLRLVALLVLPVLSATGGAIVGVTPSATAAQLNTTKTAPVQELSSVVLQLIKTVERSDALACDTRNVVVRRLRELDDALLLGRRSAAQALASAWRQDVWSMEAANVIGPELGSSLQNRLSRLQGKVGSGYDKPGPTRHWDPLPSCDITGTSSGPPTDTTVASGTAVLASNSGEVVGSYNPTIEDPMADLKIFLKIGAGLLNLVNIAVPGLGTVLSSLLGGVVDLLWPQGTGPNMANLFQDLVDTTTYNQVAFSVNQLGGQLGGTGGWNGVFGAWQLNCQQTYGGFDTNDCASAARDLYPIWYGIYSDFIGFRDAIEGAGDQVKLLALFTAYDNLFVPFLSQGVQLHQYWKADQGKGWRALDDTLENNVLVPIPLVAMDDELNPNYVDPGTGKPDRGVGYVDYIYQQGLDQQPSASSNWAARNKWIRDETLQVLDFRDMWKYLDPRAYPDGVPGGAKLTRMIYSDPVGDVVVTPSLPSNVSGPLKEITIWNKWANTLANSNSQVSSVQSTSPPSLGPAQSGAVQGDTAQPRNDAYYKNLGDAACRGTATNCAGPIIGVDAEADRRSLVTHPEWIPNAILFRFAAGGLARAGNWASSGTYKSKSYRFAYDDEVLATAQVFSSHHWSDSVGSVVQTVAFGFRNADSFSPAGEAIGVGSGKCLDVTTQVVINSCSQPPTYTQTWTYDPGLQQLSITNPAVNPADNPADNPYKYCLDTAGSAPGDGDTTVDTAVVVNPCDDGARYYDKTSDTWRTSSQRWSIDAFGDGVARITNVKSGLMLNVYNNSITSGMPLRLYTASGSTAQQWHAANPLTGEIHGIASGRCVDVPNFSTTPGTQVQISDCHGNAAQQWTYNPTNMELIYTAHPSLCLEARGGSTADGTAVQINTCTGSLRQQWKLGGNGSWISTMTPNVVMDVTGGNTTNGTLVQLYHANGTQAQQWSRPSTQGGVVYSVAAGKCLDLPNKWDNDTQAVIKSCSAPLSAGQTWVYHPIAQTFTVASPTGPKCLDARAGGTTAGTAVVINDCTGVASQRWTRDFTYSMITNVNSGLVLDLTGAGTTTIDGTTVQLSQLEKSSEGIPRPTTSQKWVWSLG